MQKTRNKVQIVIRNGVIAAFMLVTPAYAGAPVVVEYYGQNGCGDDLDMQKRFYEAVRTRDDVIFLNCRITDYPADAPGLTLQEKKENLEEVKRSNLEERGVQLFFHEFCSKRADEFGQKTEELLRGNLGTVVNGRWVASSYDVMAAIKLGATDGVKKIEVLREGETLFLMIPENVSLLKEGAGTLTLFAYAPSTGLNIGEEIEIPMKKDMREGYINSLLDDFKRLVPLKEELKKDGGCAGGCSLQEGEIDDAQAGEEYEKALAAANKAKDDVINKTFFRPVAAMKEIGVWDGSKAQYDISLSAIALETGIDLEKMGYVVLLQDGDRAAPIIGAGEIVPLEEQMQKPLSEVEVLGEAEVLNEVGE